MQEAHPIFTPFALKGLVIDLVDSSAEVRKARQIAMAQLLLIMANGARFTRDVDAGLAEGLGESCLRYNLRRS